MPKTPILYAVAMAAVVAAVSLTATRADAGSWQVTSIMNSEAHSIQTPEGRGVTVLNGSGGFSSSTGLMGAAACHGANFREGDDYDFAGYCSWMDTSGDVLYVRFERHSAVLPGGTGRMESDGGTGRFDGLKYSCSYEVTYVNDGATLITIADCDGDVPE